MPTGMADNMLDIIHKPRGKPCGRRIKNPPRRFHQLRNFLIHKDAELVNDKCPAFGEFAFLVLVIAS